MGSRYVSNLELTKLIGEAKRNLGLTRRRLRGTTGTKDEWLEADLSAIQNDVCFTPDTVVKLFGEC